MTLTDPIASADLWLARFADAAGVAQRELAARVAFGERSRETGTVGAGGDRTLEIDAIAEAAVFAALDALAAAGGEFTAISEERGVADYGGGPVTVAIDPIDGSLNAMRGLVHSSMSIAVADGPDIDDVALAFVADFGARETFHAIRGHGAFLNGTPVAPLLQERRTDDGRLELLCIETSDSRRVADLAQSLATVAYRWRILGSIASAMCQVATPRVDAMVNVTGCRAIDAAAATLIVRESGGFVRFCPSADVRLDLDVRTSLAASRTTATSSRLAELLEP